MLATSAAATGSQMTAAMRVSRSTAYVRPAAHESPPRIGASSWLTASATAWPASERNRPDS